MTAPGRGRGEKLERNVRPKPRPEKKEESGKERDLTNRREPNPKIRSEKNEKGQRKENKLVPNSSRPERHRRNKPKNSSFRRLLELGILRGAPVSEPLRKSFVSPEKGSNERKKRLKDQNSTKRGNPAETRGSLRGATDKVARKNRERRSEREKGREGVGGDSEGRE